MRLLAGLLLALVVACGEGPIPAMSAGENARKSVPAPIATVAEDDSAIPVLASDAKRGDRNALVTIVAFSDLECPYCAKLAVTLERLQRAHEGELRIVFKNDPLRGHQHARLAAEIGQGVLALAGQDAFWRYHDLTFRRQALMDDDALREWAGAAGADPKAIEEGLAKKVWAEKIDRDIALAQKLNVTATPAAFINGVVIVGAQPFAQFEEIVNDELAKARAALERGTPRERVYAERVASNLADAEAREREEMEREQERLRQEALRVHKVPVGAAPIRGNANALVTIVEFGDFQCFHCRRAEATLARILEEYGDKVRLVWKDDPLGGHERARPAAALARAARVQKGDAGFWTVHDLLFASQSSLEDEDLERVAREAKLDVPKAIAQVKAGTHDKAITEDAELAEDFGVRGTPSFFVNGRRLVGAKSFEKFKELVDEELAKAQALVDAGTKPAAIYEAVVKDGVSPRTGMPAAR